MIWPVAATADEASLEDRPAPDSVEGVAGALSRAFEARPLRSLLFPKLHEQLQSLPPFFSETELTLHLRTYYLNRSNLDGSANEALATGGWLAYRSGWWRDIASIGATLYTSQPLYAPEDRDGTRLLAPGQEGYTVLGEAWGRLRYEDHVLTVGWQTLDLPYVNRQDNRMTPNTFEGVSLGARLPAVQYIAGYLTRMKLRDATDFSPMGKVAGVDHSEAGLITAGIRVSPAGTLSFGAINHYVLDLFDILYGEASWFTRLWDDLEVRVDAQYTEQRSTPEFRRATGADDTRIGAMRLAASYRSAVLTTVFSVTDQASAIRSPFGISPGYTSLMLHDFDRAGERAWLIALSYDFARLGAPGLTVEADYAEGEGARDPSRRRALPHRREGDLTVDYRIPGGVARGFWFRVRGAILDEAGRSRTSTEIRLILNYEFSAL